MRTLIVVGEHEGSTLEKEECAMPIFRDAVHRGAEVLDIVSPGWEREVELASLDMRSCFRCVLGQIFGSYDGGMSVLAQKSGKSVDPLQFGFTAMDDDDYNDLTREWRQAIALKRGPDIP